MRIVKGLAAACVALCLGGCAGAANLASVRLGVAPTDAPAARQGPVLPTAYAVPVKTPPAIDGKLDDAAWRSAVPLALGTLNGRGKPSTATRVLLVHDNKYLYIAYDMAEPNAAKLSRKVTARDGPAYSDDSIEVFISPRGGSNFVKFAVGAGGALMDERNRNKGWNCAAKHAVQVGTEAWRVELAVPISAVGRKPSVRRPWRVNFYRSRNAGGKWEGSAWSPPMRGDYDVFGRFGQLVLGEPPEPKALPKVTGPRRPKVLGVRNGEFVLRFDLSSIPRGAAVRRAELRVFRSERITWADPEASVDIEVYPLFAAFRDGDAARPSGKPLALAPPRYDRFDATEAVRRWVNGKPNGGFFVKAGPLLAAASTCLDVAYEGEPKDLPRQVSGLKAFHRAGQTFITWRDPEDMFGDGSVTWGQIRDYMAKTDPRRRVRYRVYRHGKRINAATFQDAQLIAEVPALSGFNVNSWSFERLVNQIVFGNDDQGELGKYGPFSGLSGGSAQARKLTMPRFAVEDGQGLPPGTGVYVHSAAKNERAYYAVTAVANGVENLAAFSSANSLGRPVTETPADWEPVEQPEGEPFGFDFRGKRRFYVAWVAPPLAPRPMYFNWSVLVPPDCDKPAPVELYFHGPGYSYARPPVKFFHRSIQICPHDFPFSGWYGYNDVYGTLKSPLRGAVRPHTIRRIQAFLKWAQRKFPVDPERLIPVGGDGAALITLYRPGLFAYVISPGFESLQLRPKTGGQFAEAWGPRSPRIKSEGGLADWSWGEPDVVLAGKRLPNRKDRKQPPPVVSEDAPGLKRALPLFLCGGRSWGVDPGYARGRGRLYYAIQGTRNPLYGKWGWRRAVYPSKHTGLWRGLDITRSSALPVITANSGDVDSEAAGNANGEIIWRDVKDTPDAFEVVIHGPESTFDLTPRRLSKLEVRPGETLSWEATPVEVKTWSKAKKPDPVSGRVTADRHGRVTVTGLKLVRGWGLKVRLTKAK